MKNIICGIIGIVGGFFASAFGGWSAALTTLLIFMGIDYLSGLIVAGVFHTSPKSENGALESRVGWKGLIRKCMTLLAVLIGAAEHYRELGPDGPAHAQGDVRCSGAAESKKRGKITYNQHAMKSLSASVLQLGVIDIFHNP